MNVLRRNVEVSETAAFVLLLLLGLACASVLFVMERAVRTPTLPALVLPEAPVREQLRVDAELAGRAPTSQLARRLDGLLLEQGKAEQEPTEPTFTYAQRRRDFASALRLFLSESGEPALAALRASAAMRFEHALDMRLPKELARQVLGSFPATLERQGITRRGELVAPRFVPYTLYKARWNLLVGLPPDAGFTTIERRAFYGWQALHAEGVPVLNRIEALRAYSEAGGERVEEALGLLLVRNEEHAAAAQALQTAYERSHSLRTRNLRVAAQLASPSDMN